MLRCVAYYNHTTAYTSNLSLKKHYLSVERERRRSKIALLSEISPGVKDDSDSNQEREKNDLGKMIPMRWLPYPMGPRHTHGHAYLFTHKHARSLVHPLTHRRGYVCLCLSVGVCVRSCVFPCCVYVYVRACVPVCVLVFIILCAFVRARVICTVPASTKIKGLF